MTFKVQARMCATCIYRPTWQGTPIEVLESQVRDEHIGFKGHRICHHAPNKSQVCCAGFWARHKDEFPAGQIAQRLGLVEFVTVDRIGNSNANRRRKV